jgi:hypothetical protein
MMIHRVRALLAASIVLIAGVGAHAATTYALSCTATTQKQPLNLTLTAFSFQINAPSSVSGGHVQSYAVIVHFLPTASYSALHEFLMSNEMLKSCRLTEMEPGRGAITGKEMGGAVFQWDFSDGVLTSLTATGSDGSSTGCGGPGVPTGTMQATFSFRTFAFSSRL